MIGKLLQRSATYSALLVFCGKGKLLHTIGTNRDFCFQKLSANGTFGRKKGI